MSEVKECNRGTINPWNGIRTLRYKFDHWRDNPAYFYPDGIWVFTGPQGSGKTLSAVQCAYNMAKRYPRARVISNIGVRDFPTVVEPFEDYSQITNEDNGTDGLIFLLDEMHVLWNSLESKNVPVGEMAAFCQMRKARRIVIGTSQVYGRIAKPIREQLKYVMICKNYFGVLQVNEVCDPAYEQESDGHIAPEKVFTSVWFHSPELYAHYETLEKVEKASRKAIGGVQWSK